MTSSFTLSYLRLLAYSFLSKWVVMQIEKLLY